jgi:hypothetical protein
MKPPIVEVYLRHPDGKMDFLGSTEQADDLKERYFKLTRPGGNRLQVYVREVDESVYSKFCETSGKNGRRALPIEDRIFESGLAASQHIGLDYNEVAKQLAKAEKDGTYVAEIRGVTFVHLDSPSRFTLIGS